LESELLLFGSLLVDDGAGDVGLDVMMMTVMERWMTGTLDL
jgi:hypothetical protein